VGQTQHSSIKQTINASDAKADQPSTSEEIDYRNDLNRMLNCRKIRLNNQAKDRLPEIKAPRQKSTYTKGQNKQRQEDKKERRRAKRQSRRASGETKSPKSSTDHTDLSLTEATEMPHYASKREVLETIEYIREKFARIMHNKDKSDLTVK